jgi:hypothetical protein
MQLLYAMFLMIDPCNYYTDISEITATAVSIGVSSSVPFSELNKLIPYSTLTYFQNLFMQMIYAMILRNGIIFSLFDLNSV